MASVSVFGLMGSIFYGLNSWLPDVYVERGWSQSAAGGLLAVLNTLTIPVGFVVAWAAEPQSAESLTADVGLAPAVARRALVAERGWPEDTDALHRWSREGVRIYAIEPPH